MSTPTDAEIVAAVRRVLSRFGTDPISPSRDFAQEERAERDQAVLLSLIARLQGLAVPGEAARDYDAAILRMNREAVQTLGEQVVGLTEQLRTLEDAAREVASCPVGIIMSDVKYARLRRALERLDTVLDALPSDRVTDA